MDAAENPHKSGLRALSVSGIQLYLGQYKKEAWNEERKEISGLARP